MLFNCPEFLLFLRLSTPSLRLALLSDSTAHNPFQFIYLTSSSLSRRNR